MAFSLWSYPNQKHFKVVEGEFILHDRIDLNKIGHAFITSKAGHKSPVFVLPIESTTELVTTSEFLSGANMSLHQSITTSDVDYKELVSDAVKKISGNTDLKKVVLSRIQDVLAPKPGFTVLDDLRKKYPTAFIALFSDETLGTWVTASPELFLERTGEKLRSFSLAGTKFSNDTDLGEKEHQEQHFVTDYIKRVFSETGLSTTVNQGVEYSAGSLVHLLNVVEGVTESSNEKANELIEKLHPTPAVCGLPLEDATNFLVKEGYDRQFYTGFLGEVQSPKSFELYVNLRSAQIMERSIRFYAGAGITSDSDPDKEYEETQAKMDVLKSVLLS